MTAGLLPLPAMFDDNVAEPRAASHYESQNGILRRGYRTDRRSAP